MNPFLPLTEYIPDGEAHVYGDRVYLYGSHDRALSGRFCVDDYTVWSAPVDDLSSWTNHKVSYRKTQDPRSNGDRTVDFYAPDCVRGNDGRYYLYYVAMGPNTRNFGPVSVAVSPFPAGPFEYLGDVRYPDGRAVLKYLNNDPTVLNDGGRIWLYYGWGLGRDFRSRILSPLYTKVLSAISSRSGDEIKSTVPSILSCAVVELESDMLTVKGEPKAVLDSMTTADKNSDFYLHPFYEAPSIRKIGDMYYLVYSSGRNNELCYAVSRMPDGDYQYGGVIISSSDLGYNGNRKPKAPAGTIHGSIECINGEWYVFYHRCTNNTDFSRQACMERIEIESDGRIRQVEVTTQGASSPVKADGRLSAAYCCSLITPSQVRLGTPKAQTEPRVTVLDGETVVADMKNGTVLGYRYLEFGSLGRIGVVYRGDGRGRLEFSLSENGPSFFSLEVSPSSGWRKISCPVSIPDGVKPLYIRYRGKGRIDIREITFNE